MAAARQDARPDRHRVVAADLAALGDDELAARLAAATLLGVGIGGRTARLEVGGAPVFVKRMRLTDRERRPGSVVHFDAHPGNVLADGPVPGPGAALGRPGRRRGPPGRAIGERRVSQPGGSGGG
ncbi:hypothetical protein GCM10020358_21990 [Amorphoplanes nipponensis]|uniref:Uncharacterized protein n=1 Tax=Actinoplanes nipponensis TaxID=135950 RepID=A0A919MKQ3_9ACTN|nr:hypothetical protein [Actinoplanes nipponensis]GIE47962.1 hypothetical protein Ani05nite_14960 [Actinoplanes nipponensis]